MQKTKSKRRNGTGGVRKLSGNRRKPYMAFRSIRIEGIRKEEPLGYFQSTEEAYSFLDEYYPTDIIPNVNITLEQLYKEWSKYYFDYIGEDTQNNYKAVYNKQLGHLYQIPFANIRTAHLNKIASDMSDMSESSRQKYKLLMTALYDYAIENGICQVNLGKHINIRTKLKDKKKAINNKKPIFSDLQIKTLFKNDTKPYVDTILILIFTGFRIGELLSLTKFNVDIKEQTITGGSKTEAGKDRIVPIHPLIMPYIKKYYDSCEDGGQLIRRLDGETLKYNHYLDYCFKPALSNLGMEGFTPHRCRHTFASKYIEYSDDLKSLKEIMGHEDYGFTMNKYAHSSLDKMKNEMKKLTVRNTCVTKQEKSAK